MYATGRWTYDVPETLRTPLLLKAGLSALEQFSVGCGCYRFGDYSGAATDANGADAWVTAEYPLSLNEWGTWIHWVEHSQFPPWVVSALWWKSEGVIIRRS